MGNKKYVAVVAFLVMFGMIAALGVSSCGPQFGSRAVPTQPGPPGDFVSMSYGGTFQDAVAIVAPTANATGDPALYINNKSVAQPFQIADNGTDLIEGFDGGGVAVAAPTAVGTAVPAFRVDSAGLSNIFEVRDAATPVFSVLNGGNVTGKVLRYATAGTQIVCGSQTITDTATAVHGLTTPVYVMCNIATASPVGDSTSCFGSISSSTVTVKVRNSALTPAANAAGIAVQWCVIGTP